MLCGQDGHLYLHFEASQPGIHLYLLFPCNRKGGCARIGNEGLVLHVIHI